MKSFEEITYKYYLGEMKDHIFYEKLSNIEKNEELKHSLKRLSLMEREHAKFFYSMIKGKKEKTPKYSVYISIFLRYLLGLSLTLKILERGEKKAIRSYISLLKEGGIPEQYKQSLKAIIMDEIFHEDFFEQNEKIVAQRTERIRDAVYGMSDGLVEVLSSVAGLAPVLLIPLYVAIGGLVVGISGSLSMAIGAYLSVKAEKDYNDSKKRLNDMKSEITGEKMVEEKTYYSNPLRSALDTGVFYIIGAIFPIIPFLILKGVDAVFMAFLLVICAQSITSIIISLLSDTPIIKSLLRTVLLTITAALATYTLGNIIHSILGINI
ncbi:MAG: VIT1/CCC1 transporter family protein [Thermoplasmata archaeon]